MKTFMITCFLLAGYTITYSQGSFYSYKIEYEMHLNFSESNEYNAILYFNNNRAYFEYKIKNIEQPGRKADEEDEPKALAKPMDTTRYFVKSDFSKEKIIEFAKGPGAEKCYLITEPLTRIDWMITDTMKMIGDYNCYKARGRFGGRNYTAWFTSELPGFFGPWKLHNLPGIVLEVVDDTREVEFLVKKITTVNIPVDQFTISESCPAISKQAYYSKMEEYVSDIGKKLATKFGRDFKVNVSIPKIKAIEIYEN